MLANGDVVVRSYLTGIYPRSEDLIKATRDFERKRIAEGELEAAYRKDVVNLVQLQLDASLAYVYDGMFRWQDIYRPFVENVEGFNVGALTRYFDNNSFYKQPVVVNQLEVDDYSFLTKYIYLNLLPKGREWKAVLPGPYTFAKLSENKHYKSDEKLSIAMSEVLSGAVGYLSELGYTYFQFSEPGVVYRNNGKIPESIRQAYEIVTRTSNVRYSVQTFFGDVKNALPQLLELPVDDLGIDFTETNVESLGEYGFNRGLSAGAIDGRNSLIEKPENIAKLINRVKSVTNVKELYLCPNCELEFLPQTIAEEKVLAIKKAIDLAG